MSDDVEQLTRDYEAEVLRYMRASAKDRLSVPTLCREVEELWNALCVKIDEMNAALDRIKVEGKRADEMRRVIEEARG